MKIFNWLWALPVAATLAACGGGGGSAGNSPFGAGSGASSPGTGATGSSATTSLSLSISNTTATAAAPATVTASVRTATGAPVAGQVIFFSTAGGLGAFNANSALTNASGDATVTLTPASSSSNGADLVVAKVTVNASGLPASQLTQAIGFQVTPGGPTPVGGAPSINVALSSTSVTSATPATFTAIVKDANGVVVPGVVVKFSTAAGNFGSFNVPSALSDAAGTVTAKINPASPTANGADIAIAQATVNGVQVSASIGFNVTSVGAPAVGTPSISVALSTTTVTTATPAVVTATVKDATGAGVVGQVVKFSTVDGLGTFNVSSALTDASGVATANLSAVNATSSGADQVLVKATVNGSALQASQGFQLTAPNVTIASFTSDIPSVGAYGQSNLTVTLSGASAGTPVSVAVSSACAAKGKATVTPTNQTTTTGTATFTYRDNGCGATDPADALQATASSSVAALNLGIGSPTVTSIAFVSANPQNIFLKNSGLTQTSTVTFQVVDNGGHGLPGQLVTMNPSTLTGGLTINGGNGPVQLQSDSNGNVSVLITSGTVPTPVRVTAALTANPLIATVSSNLSIAVGLPSQLNFSLSQGTRNIEGYNIDGTTNTYNIVASDRLGNPVPFGTSVNFVAEAGGSIEPIKQTQNASGLSRATANFVSSDPRPADGRITILAYALGEESFLDLNGNNKWDPGEPFQDLGDVYLDRLYNGVYNGSHDQFIALSLPGAVLPPAPCAAPGDPLLQLDVSIPSVGGSTCDGTWGQAYVRRAIETVLSTSGANPHWNSTPPGYVAPNNDCAAATDTLIFAGYTGNESPIVGNFYRVGGTLYNVGGGTVSFIVSDANLVRLNPMAAGTTITATATTGLNVSVAGGSPVPNTIDASFASINVSYQTGYSHGTITLAIKSPSGLTTNVAFDVDAGPPPGATCP